MKKNIRVILLSPTADAVGVSTHIFNLAKILHKGGMLDTVICPNDGWLSQCLLHENIPVEIINFSYKFLKFIPSCINLEIFLERKVITGNIIHIHGRLPLFILVYSLFFRKNFCFTITIHQFSNAGSHGIFKWKLKLETFLLRYMKGICCVSRDLQHEVVSRVGKESGVLIDTIPNWIEPLWYSETDGNKIINRKKNTKSDFFNICAVGRLTHEKGFDVLIHSINFLTNSGLNIKCDIYGDGEDRIYLEQLVHTMGLDKSISFKGSVVDVRFHLPKYSVIAVPSRTESFGLVVLEAYDASLPVIASDIPGLREIVLDKNTGILFESTNPVALARAINDVLQELVDVDLIINNAYKVLRYHLLNSEFEKKYIKFYEYILSEKINT